MTANQKIAFFLPEDAAEDHGLSVVSSASGGSQPMASAQAAESVTAGQKQYGPISMDYFVVAEQGLKAPANQNKKPAIEKYKTLAKIAVPVILGLAFLAWF